MAKGRANPASAGALYRLTVSGWPPAWTWIPRAGVEPWVVATRAKPISARSAARAIPPRRNSPICKARVMASILQCAQGRAHQLAVAAADPGPGQPQSQGEDRPDQGQGQVGIGPRRVD